MINPIDDINTIANKFAELGLEVPDSVFVGVNTYRKILEQLYSSRMDYTHAAEGIPTQIQVYHIHGIATIKTDPNLHPDHLSLGRMTLNDIIIEDILLDDEIYIDVDDID